MIIVQLLGGMGNQMFQYALGKHLAILNKVELKVDTSILLNHKPGRHLVNRFYDLDIFRLKVDIATPEEIKRYNTIYLNKIEKILFHLSKKLLGDSTIKEKSFHFDPTILNLRGNVYLSGLWQSPKYFQSIEFLIREDFNFRLPLNLPSDLEHKIRSYNSVCLNVRRSDFVQVKQTSDILGFIGINYYRSASEYFLKRVKNPHFIVFSDDIEWCRENLLFLDSVTFIDHTLAGHKFSNYLYLMSLCRHFIIPNSTFAWWAAWLGQKENSIIIAPNQWFKDQAINTADLIPDHWIRL